MGTKRYTQAMSFVACHWLGSVEEIAELIDKTPQGVKGHRTRKLGAVTTNAINSSIKVNLSSRLADELRTAAAHEGLTMQAMVRLILMDFFEEYRGQHNLTPERKHFKALMQEVRRIRDKAATVIKDYHWVEQWIQGKITQSENNYEPASKADSLVLGNNGNGNRHAADLLRHRNDTTV